MLHQQCHLNQVEQFKLTTQETHKNKKHNKTKNKNKKCVVIQIEEAQDVDQLSSHGGMSVNNDMSMNNGNIGMENDMNGATMNAANIASHNSNQNDYRFDNSNRTPINTLDRLKDLYARNKLPPSLQPNSLSMVCRRKYHTFVKINGRSLIRAIFAFFFFFFFFFFYCLWQNGYSRFNQIQSKQPLSIATMTQ